MLNQIVMGGNTIEIEVREQIIEVPASEVPESEISVEISSEPLYCLCQEPWDIHNRKFMIHCDHCSDWFHGLCVGVSDVEAKDIEKYHCPKCTTTVGPSIFLDVRSRNTGKKAKSVRCTPEFIAKLKEYKCNIPDEVVLKMRGQALTLPSLITKGFSRPILIESTEALGIKLPPDTFSVQDVERYVGSERMVDVIDVERQTDILMSMREFTEYFNSPTRTKLLNLISLEFTHTNLNKLVEAPSISRKLDWVANYWPLNQGSVDEDMHPRPTVSKYCLISAKDSYTDFHIDFGGTSVWYHVLWGEKVFYLIEPSENNLILYHRWMDGEMGDECFLADEVPVTFRCVLKKGQTLLIPTGWIHAVYTPEDSLVFGGNFLHFLNMDLQLQVYEMEKQMQTPSKYLFPSFEATHWFAAEGLVQDLQTLNAASFVPGYIIKGLKALIIILKIWMGEREVGKLRREYIPTKINCKRVIQDLNKVLRVSEKRTTIKEMTRECAHMESTTSSTQKLRDPVRKNSMTMENGSIVGSSREGSPNSTNSLGKESLKFFISRASSTGEVKCSPSSSPNDHIPAPIKIPTLKIKGVKKNNPSVSPSGDEKSLNDHDASTSPKEARLLKLRLSLSDRKAESIDCDSNAGSDGLCIVESDYDFRIDTDGSSVLSEDCSRNKNRERKKHHKKCKKNKAGKMKHHREHNKEIDNALSGALTKMEDLFKTSNYSERIYKSENTSQAIKDTVAEMDAMKDTILPLKKRNKHKKKKRNPGDSGDESNGFTDGIEKVHQDEDYIYLPLAGSDDESPSKRGKKNKRGRKKEDDESWSPRAKVGPVGQRDHKSNRLNAKKESVGNGLKKAAAMLESPEKLKRKHSKVDETETETEIKTFKKPKLAVPSLSTCHEDPCSLPSTSSGSLFASNSMSRPAMSMMKKLSSSGGTAPQKKPKKGMATPKQRLGKILKINKFTRF